MISWRHGIAGRKARADFASAPLSQPRSDAQREHGIRCLSGASMRPRSLDRGNKPGFRGSPTAKMLQWGRDLSIAEMRGWSRRAGTSPSRFNGAAISRSRKSYRGDPSQAEGAMLQWGRDLSIAEIAERVGNPQISRLLQWGRDLSIAEIRVTAPICVPFRVLQWGRDLSIAEIARISISEGS
jgi:hypothetical protein